MNSGESWPQPPPPYTTNNNTNITDPDPHFKNAYANFNNEMNLHRDNLVFDGNGQLVGYQKPMPPLPRNFDQSQDTSLVNNDFANNNLLSFNSNSGQPKEELPLQFSQNFQQNQFPQFPQQQSLNQSLQIQPHDLNHQQNGGLHNTNPNFIQNQSQALMSNNRLNILPEEQLLDIDRTRSSCINFGSFDKFQSPFSGNKRMSLQPNSFMHQNIKPDLNFNNLNYPSLPHPVLDANFNQFERQSATGIQNLSQLGDLNRNNDMLPNNINDQFKMDRPIKNENINGENNNMQNLSSHFMQTPVSCSTTNGSENNNNRFMDRNIQFINNKQPPPMVRHSFNAFTNYNPMTNMNGQLLHMTKESKLHMNPFISNDPFMQMNSRPNPSFNDPNTINPFIRSSCIAAPTLQPMLSVSQIFDLPTTNSTDINGTNNNFKLADTMSYPNQLYLETPKANKTIDRPGQFKNMVQPRASYPIKQSKTLKNVLSEKLVTNNELISHPLDKQEKSETLAHSAEIQEAGRLVSINPPSVSNNSGSTSSFNIGGNGVSTGKENKYSERKKFEVTITRVNPKTDIFGLKILEVNSGKYVSYVKAGSYVSNSGIQIGDRITSVNGFTVTGVKISKVESMIQKSRSVTLSIEPNTNWLVISFTKKNLKKTGLKYRNGIIVEVSPNSFAAELGFLCQYRIMRVNGINTFSKSDSQISKILQDGQQIIIEMLPAIYTG